METVLDHWENWDWHHVGSEAWLRVHGHDMQQAWPRNINLWTCNYKGVGWSSLGFTWLFKAQSNLVKSICAISFNLVKKTQKRKKQTKLSPLSFVMFAGRPAGNACSKVSTCPARAASYIFVANAMTSGVNWGAASVSFPLFAILFCKSRSQEAWLIWFKKVDMCSQQCAGFLVISCREAPKYLKFSLIKHLWLLKRSEMIEKIQIPHIMRL